MEDPLGSQICDQVSKLKATLNDVKSEWEGARNAFEPQISFVKTGYVLVPESQVLAIKKQMAMLKQQLHHMAMPDVAPLMEGWRLAQHLSQQMENLQKACDTLVEEVNKEKEERFSVQLQCQTLGEQLSAQAAVSIELGTVLATALWRATQQEQTVQALLRAGGLQDLLTLVLRVTGPPSPEELKFVAALYGIITNITAASPGREFIMQESLGQEVVDALLSLLTNPDSAGPMKNLALMTLYNVSINRRGHTYLSSRSGVMGTLAYVLTGEKDTELRVLCLRLLQSLLYDQEDQKLVSELSEALPSNLLQSLASDPDTKLAEAALELASHLYTNA